MKHIKQISAALGLTLVVGSGIAFYIKYVSDGPPRTYDDPVELFKYGSYGSEVSGLPVPLWKALPLVCPEMLPGGWKQLGFHYEPGHDLPIGTSVRKYGVERVGINCAACHSSTVQGGAWIAGMPSNLFDSQGYNRFIINCTMGDRFTADNVLAAIDKAGVELSWLDRLIYRYYIVDEAAEQAAAAKARYAWMDTRPEQGPGRTDTVNAFRMVLDLNPGGDNVAASVDYPSLWSQGPRVKEGGGQHWDGGNDDYRERSYTSALASGTTEDSIDTAVIGRVGAWLERLPAPKFPFPVDAAKAAQGEAIWRREGCHDCHDFGGAAAGRVTAKEQLGVDPARTALFTPEMAERFKTLGVGRPWHIQRYRATGGYMNQWTDGIWARAPYLHNGSVPTLWDLLSPPEKRPAEFGRGCDSYDDKKVGWSCEGPFRYRTGLQGNSNAGHLYGTQLGDEERWALIEYMKTL
jgi:mono/diheme cytochrome c family protein